MKRSLNHPPMPNKKGMRINVSDDVEPDTRNFYPGFIQRLKKNIENNKILNMKDSLSSRNKMQRFKFLLNNDISNSLYLQF